MRFHTILMAMAFAVASGAVVGAAMLLRWALLDAGYPAPRIPEREAVQRRWDEGGRG